MPNIFPTFQSGSMYVLSPLNLNAITKQVTFGFSWITRRCIFLNDTEQRWTSRQPLFSCTLQYQSMNGYDTSVLVEFFNQMRGAYVDTALLNTFEFTLSGNTYNYCVFDQDEVEVQVDRGETLAFELKIKQLRPN